MRLRVTVQLERTSVIPLNYQHHLAAAIYHFLETADADYARFLHEDGYTPGIQNISFAGAQSIPTPSSMLAASEESVVTADPRRFKLFTFSLLWAARSRLNGPMLHLMPGTVTWIVASPVEKFLQGFATGLLGAGVLRVGPEALPIAQVETLPAPEFSETMHFKCLSPIVAAVAEKSEARSGPGKRWTRYLRPKDPAVSECVRRNLLGKYAAMYGAAPIDDHLSLTFDADYLAKHRGTKLMTYKEIQIVGAFAPFTLTGSIELMQVAYDCGLGEKNSGGFGMIEVAGR